VETTWYTVIMTEPAAPATETMPDTLWIPSFLVEETAQTSTAPLATETQPEASAVPETAPNNSGLLYAMGSALFALALLLVVFWFIAQRKN